MAHGFDIFMKAVAARLPSKMHKFNHGQDTNYDHLIYFPGNSLVLPGH
jgi:hypothetical protein